MKLLHYSCFIIMCGLLSCSETSSKDQDMANSELFNSYDPNNQSPLGNLNPDAPSQSGQFDFMVGKFDCDDSLLVNGEWKYSKATWNTEYILNGYGIKDTYRNNNYAGTSIRFFNTSKEKWDVYFFGMPGEHTGLWEGQNEDGKMVMRQSRTGPNGENLESRLTFYNITENSFDWQGELRNLDDNSSTVNWKISAKRIE